MTAQPEPYYDDDADVAAAFDDIEQHRAEAALIVRALAASDPRWDVVGCVHCGPWWTSSDEALHDDDVTRHASGCVWRRAKEWVDGQ